MKWITHHPPLLCAWTETKKLSEKIIDNTSKEIDDLHLEIKKGKALYSIVDEEYEKLASREKQIANSLSKVGNLVSRKGNQESQNQLAVLNFKNDEINKDLSTIKTHLNELYSKLKLSSSS